MVVVVVVVDNPHWLKAGVKSGMMKDILSLIIFRPGECLHVSWWGVSRNTDHSDRGQTGRAPQVIVILWLSPSNPEILEIFPDEMFQYFPTAWWWSVFPVDHLPRPGQNRTVLLRIFYQNWNIQYLSVWFLFYPVLSGRGSLAVVQCPLSGLVKVSHVVSAQFYILTDTRTDTL